MERRIAGWRGRDSRRAAGVTAVRLPGSALRYQARARVSCLVAPLETFRMSCVLCRCFARLVALFPLSSLSSEMRHSRAIVRAIMMAAEPEKRLDSEARTRWRAAATTLEGAHWQAAEQTGRVCLGRSPRQNECAGGSSSRSKS